MDSVDTVPGCSEKVVVVEAGGVSVVAVAEAMMPIRLMLLCSCGNCSYRCKLNYSALRRGSV